jgi:hypothetical protein
MSYPPIPAGSPRRLLAAGLLIAAAMVPFGCRAVATRSTAPSLVPSPSAVPSIAATEVPATSDAAAPSPTDAPSLTALGDGPPAAELAAEGGDPVTGQLGTFTWAGAGSDSAWLRGAPLAVGAGEPLSLAFQPPIATEGWRARYVPATAHDPTGATSLGEGTGPPAFAAPGPGHWTVEVAVRFADGAGSASYFWALDVSG